MILALSSNKYRNKKNSKEKKVTIFLFLKIQDFDIKQTYDLLVLLFVNISNSKEYYSYHKLFSKA
jgi:hypothetical protein